ncbi:unnamed protein product, partial [Protopolystoma xenopodis]
MFQSATSLRVQHGLIAIVRVFKRIALLEVRGSLSSTGQPKDQCPLFTSVICVQSCPSEFRLTLGSTECRDLVVLMLVHRDCRVDTGKVETLLPSVEVGVGGSHFWMQGGPNYADTLIRSSTRTKQRLILNLNRIKFNDYPPRGMISHSWKKNLETASCFQNFEIVVYGKKNFPNIEFISIAGEDHE